MISTDSENRTERGFSGESFCEFSKHSKKNELSFVYISRSTKVKPQKKPNPTEKGKF